jgi:hypothetical protein
VSTNERDRVEAACQAYWPNYDIQVGSWWEAQHARMSRALAAADALAPNDKLKQVYRDEASGPSLRKQLSEARQEIARLREALRPFAIRMPPGRHDADFYRPLDPFSRVGDHRRASAILGGGNV